MGFGKKLVLVMFISIFYANISLASSQASFLEKKLNRLFEYKSDFHKYDFGSSDWVDVFLYAVVDGVILNTKSSLEAIYSHDVLKRKTQDLKDQVIGLQTQLNLLKAELIALRVAVGNK